MSKPSMSKYANKADYYKARIVWELQQTAEGKAFYGNALRVAKDYSFLNQEDRWTLDAVASGRDDTSGKLFHALQGVIIKIDKAD